MSDSTLLRKLRNLHGDHRIVNWETLPEREQFKLGVELNQKLKQAESLLASSPEEDQEQCQALIDEFIDILRNIFIKVAPEIADNTL